MKRQGLIFLCKILKLPTAKEGLVQLDEGFNLPQPLVNPLSEPHQTLIVDSSFQCESTWPVRDLLLEYWVDEVNDKVESLPPHSSFLR